MSKILEQLLDIDNQLCARDSFQRLDSVNFDHVYFHEVEQKMLKAMHGGWKTAIALK